MTGPATEPQPASQNRWLWVVALGAAFWFIFLRGDGTQPSASNATPTPDVLGKYEQTWTVPYATTTCAQWVDDMDDHQRFVMAGDMLTGARGTGLPSDALIRTFQRAIATVCEGDSQELGLKVAEIAATLYLMSDELQP